MELICKMYFLCYGTVGRNICDLMTRRSVTNIPTFVFVPISRCQIACVDPATKHIRLNYFPTEIHGGGSINLENSKRFFELFWTGPTQSCRFFKCKMIEKINVSRFDYIPGGSSNHQKILCCVCSWYFNESAEKKLRSGCNKWFPT